MPQAKQSSQPDKTCFVVAEFGSTAESKKRSEQVLRHLIRRVLEPKGYDVVRADEIHAPGLITHQIIEHLIDDDLVVADLTGNNPNVFYEMAVRHAAAKPIVHMLTDGETIPFDVKDVRTVHYALDDPDRLEDARALFDSVVSEIDKSPSQDASNPVTVVRHLRLLESSDDPQAVEIGEVLSAIKDIRDQLRSPTSEATKFQPIYPPHAGSVRRRIYDIVHQSSSPLQTEEIATKLGMKPETVQRTLQRMRRDSQIYFLDYDVGAGWSTIPF